MNSLLPTLLILDTLLRQAAFVATGLNPASLETIKDLVRQFDRQIIQASDDIRLSKLKMLQKHYLELSKKMYRNPEEEISEILRQQLNTQLNQTWEEIKKLENIDPSSLVVD